MKFKKAQADPKELVLTIVIVALLAIVGVLIYSKVTATGNSLIDPDTAAVINETATITADSELGDDDNSTLLAKSGYIVDSESVVNGTNPFATLTRNVDYHIVVSDSTSGSLTSRANFTLLNISGEETFNASELYISYRQNVQSGAQATKAVIDTTVLDSYELGVIALVVLAAVVILAVLFRMGQ